ncbi:hypothetical protein EFA59_00295 [Weissella hellenica]|nr:hypothetical protein EFA59_00295 [Weissella hellenica]
MKNFFKLLALCLWLLTLIIFVHALIKHDLWSLTPIIAHNHIQGLFGWSLILSIIFSVIPFFTGNKKR